MANKASKTVVAGPDAAVIAALAANPQALAAYMASFSATGTVPAAAKVGPATVDLSGIAKAISEGKSEIRMTDSKNPKPYAVIKFEFGGKSQNLNVWL